MTSLVAYRLANWDTPLWSSPNRRDSRYGIAGNIVQYWCLHPLTCWAELLRFHGVREQDEARELLQRPWAAELHMPDAVLEVTFETASEHGIDPAALVDDNWTECQRWVARLDVAGIVVPSAALPGTRNVVLFGPRVRTRFGVRVVDPLIDTPCEPSADLAIVTTELLPHVRWRGHPHAGYEAWRSGEAQPEAPFIRPSAQH